MRLADALADTRRIEQKPGKVDRLLAKIHPDDLDEFMAMMLDDDNQHNDLAAWLSKMSGETVSSTTVGEWRRGKGVQV